MSSSKSEKENKEGKPAQDEGQKFMERIFEEGGPGTQIDRKDDPLTEYREKEPMTPAKIMSHEPTAIKRDTSDQKIVPQSEVGPNPKEAREIARSKGMAKGTAGAAPTGDEYQTGASGTNKPIVEEQE